MSTLVKNAVTSANVAFARVRSKTMGCLVCSAPVPERNRGDQALLAVVVRELHRRGCGPLTVLTASDQPITSLVPSDQLRIRTDLYPLFLTRRCFQEELQFPQLAARHLEMMMIGADVLDEGYGVERSVSSMYTLGLATRVGLPSRIFGFSVNGPPSVGLRERLNRLGSRVRLFVRDPESYRRLEAAGIAGIERAGDLAFLLEPSDGTELDPPLRSFLDQYAGRLIGLNLTQVVLGEYGAEEERLQLIAAACQRLADEDGWRFVLIPHDEPEGVEYLRAFQNRLQQKCPDSSILVDPLPHSRSLKFIAGQCTHVFTCRLHLGIATLGMGRPMTGFPYQGKFEGQFELFGLEHDGLIPPDRFPSTVEDMVGMMRNRISQSESLSEQITRHLPKVLELAMRNFDGLGVSNGEASQ
ncbi:polysaccharide pyruvyl transferase family protein [Planctomycetaceae bacterium SH139]